MKSRLALLSSVLLSALVFADATLGATPLGTAISYQGRLDDGGRPANGAYSFRYRLLADPDGATQVGPVVDLPNQVIGGGLLTASLDFGPAAFTGEARWLEISVKQGGPGAADEYTKLNPQPLPPGGSSQYARLAGDVVNGTITGAKLTPLAITTTHISDGAITGAKIDSGQVVKSLNGLQDQVTLAAGANVVLTTNGNTLTLSATGSGGSGGWSLSGNAIVPGNFIGTLGSQPLEFRVNNSRALLLQANATSPNLVGGWAGNAVDTGVNGATIAGGGVETVLGRTGTNRVADHFGTVSGGANNVAGLANGDFQDGWFATVGGGQFNRAEGVASTIGGGSENRASTNDTTVGGGWRNQALNLRATVAGGEGNVAGEAYSAVGGGMNNRAEAMASVVGGGIGNTITATAGDSTIAGGNQNQIASNALRSVISGGYSNTISEGSPRSTIGGGESHLIDFQAHGGTISGGYGSHIGATAAYATIGGGDENFIRASGGTVAGGFLNRVHEGQGAVGGGYHNIVGGYASTVAGGSENSAGSGLGDYATVGGGFVNQAYAEYASIGGGYRNISGGDGATVPGGLFNEARGATSFAAGRHAKALDDGSFVWADSTEADFGYPGANKFQVRSSGGVLFYANPDGNVGVYLAPGGNSWAPTSDRNAKENFREMDPREILAKVVKLPILNYNLKSQTNTIRHLGPMAQDFHAAFQLGEDDKHITTIDADGVALAAIQGLNHKLERAVKEKDARIEQLEQRLEKLEQLVTQQQGVIK